MEGLGCGASEEEAERETVFDCLGAALALVWGMSVAWVVRNVGWGMGDGGVAKGIDKRTRKHGMRGITEESELSTAPGWEGGAEEEGPLLDVSCFPGWVLVM